MNEDLPREEFMAVIKDVLTGLVYEDEMEYRLSEIIAFYAEEVRAELTDRQLATIEEMLKRFGELVLCDRCRQSLSH